MRTWSIPLVLASVALATGVRADEHEEMRAALHELKIAQRHLKAAPITYEGHRMAALRAVAEALKEIREGLAPIRREKQGNAARRGAAPGAATGGNDD